MYPILDIFRHETFGVLHTAIVDGKIMFNVDDVCKPLEYPKITSALYMLDTDEYALVGDGTFISESGLYTLVIQSSNPYAREYKRWIRDTVIPELRAKNASNNTDLTKDICTNTMAILELVKKIKDDTSTLKNVKVSFEDELPF